MKMKTNPCLKDLLILFGLHVSAFLVSSEYVDCQNIFPDENLDFSAIAWVSQKQCPASRVSIFMASVSIPKHSWSSHLPLKVFSPQSINSRMALATILRCQIGPISPSQSQAVINQMFPPWPRGVGSAYPMMFQEMQQRARVNETHEVKK
jgi:hypothetical protein